MKSHGGWRSDLFQKLTWSGWAGRCAHPLRGPARGLGQRPLSPPSCPAGFTGPPDPLHGNSLYQKVRAAAQVSPGPAPRGPSGSPAGWPSGGRGHSRMCGHTERPHSCLGLGEHLVLGHPVPSSPLPASQGPASRRYAALSSPSRGSPGVGPRGLLSKYQGDSGPPAGMGSQSRPQSALQGFGYSKEPGPTGECCLDSGCGLGGRDGDSGQEGPVPTNGHADAAWAGGRSGHRSAGLS